MGDIKEAFKRVKEDIYSLNQEVSSLKEEINTLRKSIKELKQITQVSQNFSNFTPDFSDQQYKSPNNPTNNPDYGLDNGFDNSTHPSTDRQINSTDQAHPSTDRHGFKPLNGQNLRISIGNKGVSTDRQTHRQTHRQQDYANFKQPIKSTENYNNPQLDKGNFNENFSQDIQNSSEYPEYNQYINYTQDRDKNTYVQEKQNYFPNKNHPNQEEGSYSSSNSFRYPLESNTQDSSFVYNKNKDNNRGTVSPNFPSQIHSPDKTINQEQSTMNNALEILNSLDSIKKEVRFKFKKLTDQEMSVFSTLYQLGEENKIANYKSVSKKLNLSESSIRDYVGRLMKKGIPVEKERINNKTIHLKISEDLKKIATLPTILKLRDI